MKVFKARDTDFITRGNKHRLLLFAVAALGLLFITYITYYLYVRAFIDNPDGLRPKLHVLRAISELSFTKIASVVAFALIVAFILMGFAFHQFEYRDVVTGLTFNDQQQLLSIQTHTIDGGELKKITVPYKNIRIVQQTVATPNGKDNHLALAILQNGTCIGLVLKDHFTWDDATFAEINSLFKIFRRV